mmetsp:Transcript_11670/g.22606  ORF Transcript_11670/g.22606 Transcript_11670/m.22606 type:complete len:237 (+) Transcript_11670:255-965(+)
MTWPSHPARSANVPDSNRHPALPAPVVLRNELQLIHRSTKRIRPRRHCWAHSPAAPLHCRQRRPHVTPMVLSRCPKLLLMKQGRVAAPHMVLQCQAVAPSPSPTHATLSDPLKGLCLCHAVWILRAEWLHRLGAEWLHHLAAVWPHHHEALVLQVSAQPVRGPAVPQRRGESPGTPVAGPPARCPWQLMALGCLEVPQMCHTKSSDSPAVVSGIGTRLLVLVHAWCGLDKVWPHQT